MISFGLIDDRAVFMDERTDTYFTLAADDEEHLRDLLERGVPLEREAALLEALGARDDEVEVLRARYPSPSASLLEQQRLPRARLHDVITITRLVLKARCQLRSQPIETVLRRLVAPPESGSAGELGPDELDIESGRFLAARKLVPVERNCLLDSLALLRWLGAHRSGAALLFGVKLDPFAAHCWVQSGNLVLNDRVETVAAFTPVRVIRCSAVTP